MYAQRVIDINKGEFSTTSDMAPSVAKTVTPIDGGYRVEYLFNKAVFIPVSDYADAEECILEGFTINHIPGYPAFPYSSDFFFVPKGEVATVTLLSQEWIEIEGKPSPGKSYRSTNDSITDPSYDFQPILPYNGFFPNNLIEKEQIIPYRDCELVKIGITPVQYDNANGIIRLCKSLEYEVHISSCLSSYGIDSVEKSSDSNDYEYDPYLSLITANYDFEQSNDRATKSRDNSPNLNFNLDPKTFLIISIPEYSSAIKKLANWKKTIGFNVIERYRASWTSTSIQQVINETKDSGITIDYLLLIGNHSQVPAHSVSYKLPLVNRLINAVSDIYYTTKSNTTNDQTGIMPQFSYGRLPVNNKDEALNVVNKIISYEKTPPDNADFYNSGLFISHMECNSNGVAHRRNTQTAYELSSYLKELGKQPEILFHTLPSANPKLWSDYSYKRDANGSCISSLTKDIPIEIQKPQYAWNASSSDIITSINSGRNLAYYFSHGLSDSWNNMHFSTSSLENLHNQNKLPLILSMACHTANFTSQGCLGEKFITKSDGGAIAFLGFTEETFTPHTEMISFHIFNGLWPSPGISAPVSWSSNQFMPSTNNSSKGIMELGALHRYALTRTVGDMKIIPLTDKYNEYQVAIFSLLGDPSVNFQKDKPMPIKAKYIINKNNELEITPSSKCILTVYNKHTGSVNNTYVTNSISIPVAQVTSDCILTFHAPGLIPHTLKIPSVGEKQVQRKEQDKMISTDKVWKYYTTSNWYMWEDDPELNQDDYIYIKMRFSGTVEIEGHTYLKCYLYKERDTFNPETAALAAYMREEDNRIYVRYLKSTYGSPLTNGIAFILNGGPTYIDFFDYEWENDYTQERCIYDYNLEIGDRFVLSEGYPEFTVNDIKYVEYADNQYEQMFYHNDELGSYSAIRAVGPELGLIPFPNQWSFTLSETPWELFGMFDEYDRPIYLTHTGILGVEDIDDDVSEIILSDGILRIKTHRPECVKFIDTEGRTVWSAKCDKTLEFDTSDIIPGLYIAVTSSARKKIIIK